MKGSVKIFFGLSESGLKINRKIVDINILKITKIGFSDDAAIY